MRKTHRKTVLKSIGRSPDIFASGMLCMHENVQDNNKNGMKTATATATKREKEEAVDGDSGNANNNKQRKCCAKKKKKQRQQQQQKQRAKKKQYFTWHNTHIYTSLMFALRSFLGTFFGLLSFD